MTADEVIALLQLEKHPEGGAYRETYRSHVAAHTPEDRSVCTAIYYLLRRGERSAWHRVRYDERYHFYSGDALELSLITSDGQWSRHRLGADLRAGERPQRLIPGGVWQSAISLGAFSLIGCTVSPGFDFRDFEMIEAERLIDAFPQLSTNLRERTP